jgi:hypothetical protein
MLLPRVGIDAEAMVNMTSSEPEMVVRRQTGKNMQENYRIDAAGEADNDLLLRLGMRRQNRVDGGDNRMNCGLKPGLNPWLNPGFGQRRFNKPALSRLAISAGVVP